MPASNWDSLYKTAYQKGIKRINEIPGVCCAFHSVIDGLIHITPDLIEPQLEKNPSLKQAALAGCKGESPLEIYTREDFIQGLFFSLSRGAAAQQMIRNREVHQWVLKTFGPGEYRLGGTAGNMARSLAPLGLPVTAYANPLTVELADLFGDYSNLSVIVKRDGDIKRITPQEAAIDKGIFAIHWILEYDADFVMYIDGVKVQPHRANRYIPSWNPVNNQFKMDADFADGFLSLSDSYSHLLFSGFHILSEKYPDGQDCIDTIKPLSEYLIQLNQKTPQLKIHLEMASIASPMIRKAIVEYIIPHVHSIGLNETELPLILESIDPVITKETLENPSVPHFCRAIATLLKNTSLERVHFHNLGYYLCLEREPWTSREASRDALLLAATMAAARAQNGLFTSLDDIEAGLAPDVVQCGLDELQSLSESLKQPDLIETGIGTFEDWNLYFTPTRLVEKPLFTVGLGDTISSGAFLTT
jgi:ADP-dependent phosphofructokinase/glucokinase